MSIPTLTSSTALLVLAAGANRALSSDALITGEQRAHHLVTLSYTGPQADESGTPNPFLDYRLNVTFTDGTRTLVVPGFFAADGNALQTGAASGEIYTLYIAAGGNVSLNLGSSTGPFEVRWFDPRADAPLLTGSVASITGPGPQPIGSLPDSPSEDWAVLVRRSACEPDLIADGELNISDLLEYLDRFETRQPDADLAAPEGEFDIFHVLAFLDLFENGCPAG